MKISIITATYNSSKTIKTCLDSLDKQTYRNFEHIIIDGSSTDNTLDLIHSRSAKNTILISEPDNGIYSALNKGISLATGDVIGILSSDDFFTENDILEKVDSEFSRGDIDALYGDVKFVDPNDTKKIVRYYSSRKFDPDMFKNGFMPAHPSFYAKKELFKKYGNYNESYKIAGDFELLIRFLYHHKIKYRYLPISFVTMRTGGISTKKFSSNYLINKEIVRACRENGISTNYFKVYAKYFIKIFEFFRIS